MPKAWGGLCILLESCTEPASQCPAGQDNCALFLTVLSGGTELLFRQDKNSRVTVLGRTPLPAARESHLIPCRGYPAI